MAKTISGNIPNGYVLADATLNPITNLGTIALGTSSNAAALEGTTVAAWIVVNQGTVDGGAGSGIDLLAGGTVTNDGWIGGIYGVAIQGIAGTVVNASTIDASSGSAGILLTHGGSVTNQAAGQILGSYGISTKGDAATVLNAGTIVADTADAAIELAAGGSVTNAASASLTGNWGIAIQGSANGSVLNAGAITGGTQSGVFLTGGTVTNQSHGVITGNWAVAVVGAAGTVINGGTMIGTGGTAVTLPAGYANLVQVQPGAAFTGAVQGGNTIGASIASTLELAAGITAGTLAGIGSTITNFSGIVFDPGARWDISGMLAGFGGSVSGFAPTDTIHLTDVVANSGTYASGELNLYDNGTPVGQIAITGSFASDSFVVDPANGITVACFAAGTRIATPDGDAAIETLAPGQRISLANGGSAPIRWIGRRRIACDRHPNPPTVWPIRIAAGAFGSGRPNRELLLSPDHAVFIDAEGGAPGVLIPIRCLLNGVTVVQDRPSEVTYFHLELPAHEVILAEGLACESYLDLGNRSAFDNGEGALLLHPDLATRIWQRDACAELILGGPMLAAARWQLIRQADRLGHAATDDPELRLRVGQKLLRPERAGLGLRFLLPSGARFARLLSRTCIHADIEHADTTRCRGVAVAGLLLDRQAIDLADRRLGAGWHKPAAGSRCTDGDARIGLLRAAACVKSC